MSDQETTFTEHVRALAAGKGKYCDDAVWESLWNVLKAEIRRRGLWNHSPSLLGYDGDRWEDDEAREAIVADAWRRGIRSRLPGIQRNLKRRGNVDKLVKGNLRHFIGECQEQEDPIGRALFVNIRRALIALCERGVLTRHGKELHDKWAAQDEFGTSDSTDTAASAVEQIQQGLEPSGIQFEGLELLRKKREQPVPQLVKALAQLPEQGCRRFSVAGLKAGLIELGRAAGISLETQRERRFSDSDPEILENVRTAAETHGYQQSELQESTFRLIHEAIDTASWSDVIKDRRHRVAEYFQSVLQEHEGDGEATVRELATKFGTTRSTMDGDIQAVRQLSRHVLINTGVLTEESRHV